MACKDPAIRHLEMIESNIDRMSRNSFELKGWTVAIVSLMSVLSSKDSNTKIFWLSFIPVFTFWFLDSYYLSLERQFRALYRKVSESESLDLCMERDIGELQPFCNKSLHFLACVFSKTELLFYLPLLGAVSLVMCLLDKA